MGNLTSREEKLSAAAIEEMYAARAAAAEASREHDAKNAREEAAKEDTNKPQANANGEASDYGPEQAPARNPFEPQVDGTVAIQRTAEALRGSIPQNLAVSAACHISIAIHAYHAKAAGAFEYAIAELKKLGIINVAKVIDAWIKAHPWETAAIVVPLILVACTPAVLGAVGFGAGGIVAGSIAAGIQAGIGNVVAGSAFAVLTSAMMGGSGLVVVLGGVWGVSTAVVGGIALLKRWCSHGDADDTNAGNYTCLAIEDNDKNDASDGDEPEGTYWV